MAAPRLSGAIIFLIIPRDFNAAIIEIQVPATMSYIFSLEFLWYIPLRSETTVILHQWTAMRHVLVQLQLGYNQLTQLQSLGYLKYDCLMRDRYYRSIYSNFLVFLSDIDSISIAQRLR